MVVEEKNDSKIYINYSKLINEITDSTTSFRNTITSESFSKHVAIYIETNDLIKNYEYVKFENVKDLCEKTDGLFYQREGGNSKTRGTYGPYDFVDTLLMIHDYKYAVEVHKLLHAIDTKATHKHTNFKKQLQKEIDELKFEIEILTRANEDIEEYIIEKDFYESRIEELGELINENNPAINYSLINEIDMLKERQINSNLMVIYYNALKQLNSSTWESLIKPKLKHIIKVIKPNFKFDSIDKDDHDEMIRTIFKLLNSNKEEIEIIIGNSIGDVFN